MKTKNAIITLFLIFGMSNLSSAQVTFQKAFGGESYDGGYCVQQTTDGGYIVSGSTRSFGPTWANVYLVKTDADGDLLWTKAFGGTNQEWGYSVQQTSDGGYIVAGATLSFGGGSDDVYLIRTDANGDTLWTKTIGGTNQDVARSIQQTADGGFIAVGGTIAGNSYVYLIKTDSNGNISWTKRIGGTLDCGGSGVRQTADGGYVITGSTAGAGVDVGNVYLIKTDAEGDPLWTKSYGGTGEDQGFSVQQTSDSGFIISGSTDSFGVGGVDIYLIRTDANGTALWSKTYGGVNDDEALSARQTADGGYIITGTCNYYGGNSDIYLIRTDANGEILWVRGFGGIMDDIGGSAEQTNDGGFIITGNTECFGAGLTDVYLIKTDASGNSAGCNQHNMATTVTTPATVTTDLPIPTVSSTGTIRSWSTQVGSGGNDLTLCTTVGFNEISTGNSFSIHPNPAMNNFTLLLSSGYDYATLHIFNFLGEQIHEQTIKQPSTFINLDSPPGIYLVKVSDGKNTHWQKLIIQSGY